jgi:hypothetical protein
MTSYYKLRDVYPLRGSVSTRGTTKVESSAPNKMVNEREATEDSIIDMEDSKKMAMILIGIVAVLYMVNRFGK